MKKIWVAVIILCCLSAQLSAQAVSFYQSQFNGGVTTGGCSATFGLQPTTGTFTIAIAPNSTIHKAFLLAGRQGVAPDLTVTLNGDSLTFNNSNQGSPAFQSPEYGGNSAVHAIDVTSLIDSSVNNYTLIIPGQGPSGTNDRYTDFYLYVAFENSAMKLTSTSIFLNARDFQDTMLYNLSLSTPMVANKAAGLALFTGYVCNTLPDNEYVWVNDSLIGNIGGPDFNSTICGGPMGSFVYQNDSLRGLGDDTADLTMKGPDALSNIQTLLTGCTDTLSIMCQHGPSGQQKDNAIWALILAYAPGAGPIGMEDSATICVGGSVPLSISAGSGTVLWSPSTALSCTTCPNPTASPAINTTYIATVSGDVCGTKKDTIVITVDSLPAITITPHDTSICTGGSALLRANASGSVNWFSADSFNCVNCNATVATPNSTATYFASTGTGSCRVVDSALVTVTPLPAITVSNDTSICPGGQARLTVTGTGPVLWSPVGGLSCTTCANPVAAPGATTTYQVLVGTGTCTSKDTVLVAVKTIPAVTATLSDNSICANDSAQLCAPAGFAAYLWNTGSLARCFYTNQAGNYYLTVTDADGCTAASNREALTVFASPPVSISVEGDTLVAYNAVSYQWYRDGVAIADATEGIYIVTEPANYTVQVTDGNGCTALSNPIVFTGLPDITANEIKAWPNPSSENGWQLSLSKHHLGSTIEIYDNNGRLVYQSIANNTTIHVGEGLPGGIYVLRVGPKGAGIILKLVRV